MQGTTICKVNLWLMNDVYIWRLRILYLSGRGWFEGEHVGKGRDNVNGEADKKRSNGGVNGTKEGEYNGQEPNWDHHWQSY